MGVHVEAVGGVGFAINPDEVCKLKKRFQVDSVFELFDEDGKITLPNGFNFCRFDGHDEECGVLIIADIIPALINPALMPNWSIAQAWAKKWCINFTHPEPNLHIYKHSY